MTTISITTTSTESGTSPSMSTANPRIFGLPRIVDEPDAKGIELPDSAPDETGVRSRGNERETVLSFDPTARSLGDLVMSKQLRLIRRIAGDIGIDADLECERNFGCEPGELSRHAAESFIDRLECLRVARPEALRMAG